MWVLGMWVLGTELSSLHHHRLWNLQPLTRYTERSVWFLCNLVRGLFLLTHTPPGPLCVGAERCGEGTCGLTLGDINKL